MNSSLLLLLSLLPQFSESEKLALIENIKKLKVPQNRDICKLVGLPPRGVKSDLLNRLVQHIEARYTMRQYPELLALQTLVLKLLYNSPLPNYNQLVNAIRTGTISAGSVASLLEQFQMALNMATLARMALMAASAPMNSGSGNNNAMLGQNGNFSLLSAAERAIFLANQNSQNAVNGLGNSAQMHLNAMGRTIGGMSGLRQDAQHINPMGHMVGMGNQVGSAGMGRPGELENQYLGPMLLFKSTIFYLLRKLVGTPQVLRASKGRNIKSFRLKLHSSEVKLLRQSPNMKLYIFSGTESTPDHTNTPIQFPPIEIYVDDALTKQHTKGIKGKPGSARPADLTPYFSLFDRAILVRIVYSDALEKYIFYTYIVEEIPLDQLSKEIESKPHIPTSTTRLTIQKENEAGADEDEDIVVATSSLSLRCPLTYARMKQPVRSIYCDHIQCFDGPSFLSMQQRIPLWQCPVCSAYIDQHSLAVSDYITEILKSTSDSVDSVILNPDGLWHAIEGETILDSEDEDIPLKRVPLKSTKEESIAREDPIEVISLDSDSEVENNATLIPPPPSQNIQQTQPLLQQHQSQKQKESAPQPPASPIPDQTDVPSGESYIQPPLRANSDHVHSVEVNIPRSEEGNLDRANNSENLGDDENGKGQRLERVGIPQVTNSSLSNLNPPLALVSDSTLSAVSVQSAQGPLPSESFQEESEDEDTVLARPRRRAVVTDASDNEVSRPASAVPAEKTTPKLMQQVNTNNGNDSSAMVQASAPASATLTPTISQSAPQTTQLLFETWQSSNDGTRSQDPGLISQPVAGPLKYRENYTPQQEALLIRAMRQFLQVPANANPFAHEQQSETNRGIAMLGGTQPSPTVSVGSTTESPESVHENGLQYVIRPSQPQLNESPHLTAQGYPINRSINSNMVMLPVTNQENVSGANGNPHSVHSIIRNANNPHTISSAIAHISNSSHLNVSYPGLPRLASSGQMLGNFYGNPTYQQIVNESRAKISAYMQLKDSGPDLLPFLSSLHPIAANGNILEPIMAPVRAHSTSTLQQRQDSVSNAAAGASDDSRASINDGIRGPWATPKKRNNSVPSGSREIEATMASPKEADWSKRTTKSQIQLDALINRSGREQNDNSNAGAADISSNSNDKDLGDMPSNSVGSTDISASKESMSENSSIDNKTEKENTQSANGGALHATSPRFSANPFAESGSTLEQSSDVPQQPPQQLFVSPMGSAIMDLSLTTPSKRKRPSADADATRLWNKKINQSPSAPTTTVNKKSGSVTTSTTAKSGKAKFDPSTINQADIIELD